MRTALTISIALILCAACGTVESPPPPDDGDGDRAQPALAFEGRGSPFWIDLPSEAGTLDNLPDVHLLIRCSGQDWTVYPLAFHNFSFAARIPELGDASPLRVSASYMQACPNPVGDWLVIVRYGR